MSLPASESAVRLASSGRVQALDGYLHPHSASPCDFDPFVLYGNRFMSSFLQCWYRCSRIEWKESDSANRSRLGELPWRICREHSAYRRCFHLILAKRLILKEESLRNIVSNPGAHSLLSRLFLYSQRDSHCCRVRSIGVKELASPPSEDGDAEGSDPGVDRCLYKFQYYRL